MLKLNEKNIGQFNLISTSLILILFAITIIYLSVTSKKEDFNILKQEVKNKFIQEKKQEIKFKVDNTNQLITIKSKRALLVLQKTIKERVDNVHKIATKTYLDNKELKTNDEIINIIKDILRPVRFENGKGYFFMVSMDGNEILFPINPKLEIGRASCRERV